MCRALCQVPEKTEASGQERWGDFCNQTKSLQSNQKLKGGRRHKGVLKPAGSVPLGLWSLALLGHLLPRMPTEVGLKPYCDRKREENKFKLSFCRGSSQNRDWTLVFHNAGRFFVRWTTREALNYCHLSLSCIWLFATPWAVAHQAPLSMGFPRQEYRGRLPFPSGGRGHLSYTQSLKCFVVLFLNLINLFDHAEHLAGSIPHPLLWKGGVLNIGLLGKYQVKVFLMT